MIRTIRLNAHPTRDRAMEEVRGLILAFQGHYLANKRGFAIDAAPYQGEFHVTFTADVDTSQDGFLSLIIARQLAAHLRVPAPAPRLAAPRAAPVAIGTIRQRALAQIPRPRR